NDANPATHRTMKDIRPMKFPDRSPIHYLWKIGAEMPPEDLANSAKNVAILGWGVDLVVGNARVVSSAEAESLEGERWQGNSDSTRSILRHPVSGSLEALLQNHSAFLERLQNGGAPRSQAVFGQIGYQRPKDSASRPHAFFELRNPDHTFCQYPQAKLIHIAGMLRHAAKRVALKSTPEDVPPSWVEEYILGHQSDSQHEHRQLSYVPIPSIGHEHSDHAIRRVMIAGPQGDRAWLEFVAGRIDGSVLEPERGNEFRSQTPPSLRRIAPDSVCRRYQRPSNRWVSVTPVILPGHDDRKDSKTKKLVKKALAQAGITQECEFSWSSYSRFKKSLPAHKYRKDGRPVYFKPGYLQNLTAIHLEIVFSDEVEISGPIVIGSGRHCGFGLMAVAP
ncbi:MAG: type I-U CRISPR-associated protein Csb2, partial [Verrucomicrobiota bacterium]